MAPSPSTPSEKPWPTDLSVRVMRHLEQWGYITTGLSFLCLGMIVFSYGWYLFFFDLQKGVLPAALSLMNDLLLVLILLELFKTIMNYLVTHTITLEPFFYVGIVAAIREILTTNAQKTVSHIVSDQEFNRYLGNIGFNGLLIVVLVLSLFLYKKQLALKA